MNPVLGGSARPAGESSTPRRAHVRGVGTRLLESGDLMPMFRFRMGDVFGVDDLSVWICTLSVAFNDAVHANVKADEAQREWESVYEWRVAMSHFTEACLHLERGRGMESVMQFLESEPDLKPMFDEALTRYDTVRQVAQRIRNEAGFHYPYESGRRALTDVLLELADEQRVVGEAGPTRIRDSRQLYANDVIAALVFKAAGGTEETYTEAAPVLRKP
jgi:hypothetical protein